MLKLKLVESKLFEKFDPSLELTYDAQELVIDTDDEDKSMYGTIEVDVDNVLYYLWDFIDQDDDKNEIISDEQLNIFSNDNNAWEMWVEENYQMLLNRYIDDFKRVFFETAQDNLYSNWDNHCDEQPFDQDKSDMDDYYDLVARNLRLR